MNNKLKNVRLNLKRGEVVYKIYQENKTELTVEEIAKIFNVSEQSLYRIIKEHKEREWKNRNKDKVKTHVMVAKAIREGVITRSPVCQKCNAKEKTIGHHEDYNKPLEVKWLCQSCHKRTHQGTLKEVDIILK